MARSSRPQRQKNPSTRWFEWAGADDKGIVQYWDKEIKTDRLLKNGEPAETGDYVPVKLPFTFLVLDQLSVIGGFNDEAQASYRSNEVRDLSTQPLTIRLGRNVIMTAVYKDVKIVGAKYGKSIYIAYKNDTGELAIGNLKLFGAGVSAWIDFTNKHRDALDTGAVMMDVDREPDGKPKIYTKGRNKYLVPAFKLNPKVDPKTDKAAIALGDQLQDYFDSYFSPAAQAERIREAEAPVDYRTQRDIELNDYDQTDDMNEAAGVKDMDEPEYPDYNPTDDDIPF